LQRGNETGFSPEYSEWLAQRYTEALGIGFKERFGSIDFNAVDHAANTMMEANLFRFSAAKSLGVVQQLNEILRDSSGFSDFKLKASPLLDNVNGNWMRTEYNTAISVSQNASNFYSQLEDIEDAPFIEYQTVGDDRVRAAHAALDGMIFKVDSSVWDTIYPPNGDGCRCEGITRDSLGNKKLSKPKDALDALSESGELERMRKRGFDVNKAKLQEVFDSNNFYIKEFDRQKFNVETNGVKPFNKLTGLKDLNLKDRDNDFIDKWFSDRVGKNDLDNDNIIRLLDNRKRPVTLDRKTITGKNRNLIEQIPGLLAQPDEVYLRKRGSQKFTFEYFKFFKGSALRVVVDFENGVPQKIRKINQITKDIDNSRAP